MDSVNKREDQDCTLVRRAIIESRLKPARHQADLVQPLFAVAMLWQRAAVRSTPTRKVASLDFELVQRMGVF
jgi:hypothetical protein